MRASLRALIDFIETVARYRTGLILLTDNEPALSAWSQASREDLYVELTPGPDMHHSLLAGRRVDLPPVAPIACISSDRMNLPCIVSYHCAQYHLVPPAVGGVLLTHALVDAAGGHGRPLSACSSSTRAYNSYRQRVPHRLEFSRYYLPTFHRLSDEEACTLLREKPYDGACKRYGTISPEIRLRIEHDCHLFIEKDSSITF